MSHPEDSFNDAELTLLAMEITRDFHELSTKANIDPDDSFVSKFNIGHDIIQPSRSISYSDEQRSSYNPMYDHDQDECDNLTIISLSANDSLKSIPSIPQKQDTINIHKNKYQTKYQSISKYQTKYLSSKNNSYSPKSSISMISPSASTRKPSNNAYSTSKHSTTTSPCTLSPNISPLQSIQIDVSRCLSPKKSIPKHNKKHSYIYNPKRKRKRKSIRKRKRETQNRNREKDTKRFYHMRSTQSLCINNRNKQRRKSQYNRLNKNKNKRKHNSDALQRMRATYIDTVPQEPAPYFVKRGRTTNNTPIDLSDETDPFYNNNKQYLFKTKSIRFLYNNDDDDNNNVQKVKKKKKCVMKQRKSMFLMPQCGDEYMVELDDGFMFINNE